MPICRECGSEMEGAVCYKCGAAVSSAPVVPIDRPGAGAALGVDGASALCYLLGFVTGVVFLVLVPYNRNRVVRFHAFQSIFLSVAALLLHAAVTIVALVTQLVSFSLGVMVSSLHLVVSLGFFVLWIYMMWKSYDGKKVVLPVIGELAEKQAGGPSASSGTMGRAA